MDNNIFSLEIPKFCMQKGSFIRIKWGFKNNGKYEPKAHFFFNSKNKPQSPINLKLCQSTMFLFKVKIDNFTNIIKTMGVCCRINSTLKNNCFLDFSYFSSSGLNLDEILEKNIEKNTVKKFNNKKILENLNFPIDLIPMSFTRFKHFKNTFIYNYNTTIFRKLYGVNDNLFFFKNYQSNPLGLDRRSNFSIKSKFPSYMDFKIDPVPNKPNNNYKECLRLIPSFALGFLLRLYKHRPIWTRKRIEKNIPISIKKYLKQILPIISYRFKGENPFKDTWLRFKYDPRKNFKTRIYQTYGFIKIQDEICSVKLDKTKNKRNRQFEKKSMQLKRLDLKKKDKKYISKKQICDLSEFEFRKTLEKRISPTITLTSGWF